jgi:hypothetical protein
MNVRGGKKKGLVWYDQGLCTLDVGVELQAKRSCVGEVSSGSKRVEDTMRVKHESTSYLRRPRRAWMRERESSLVSRK